MKTQIERLLALTADLRTYARPKTVWVACSGGLDSVVLLFLLDALQRQEKDFALGILHVNYSLRGEESDRDEAFVRELAARYQRELRVLKIRPEQHPPEKTGIQEWARTVRYDFFQEQLGPEDWLAIAHHKDDLIENILARIARGHSLLDVPGMQGMHRRQWRPLLAWKRVELQALAQEQQLSHVEDSSNQSQDYTRNQLRLKILPELEQLFPGVGQNLWQHAMDLQDCLGALQNFYPALEFGETLGWADLAARPPVLARHEIQRFLQGKLPGFRAARELLLNLHTALKTGSSSQRVLEPGTSAFCEGGVLRLVIKKEQLSERWLQYRTALLDESPDVWPDPNAQRQKLPPPSCS